MMKKIIVFTIVCSATNYVLGMHYHLGDQPPIVAPLGWQPDDLYEDQDTWGMVKKAQRNCARGITNITHFNSDGELEDQGNISPRYPTRSVALRSAVPAQKETSIESNIEAKMKKEPSKEPSKETQRTLAAVAATAVLPSSANPRSPKASNLAVSKVTADPLTVLAQIDSPAALSHSRMAALILACPQSKPADTVISNVLSGLSESDRSKILAEVKKSREEEAVKALSAYKAAEKTVKVLEACKDTMGTAPIDAPMVDFDGLELVYQRSRRGIRHLEDPLEGDRDMADQEKTDLRTI